MKPNRSPLELRVSDQESLLPEGGRARIVGPRRAADLDWMMREARRWSVTPWSDTRSEQPALYAARLAAGKRREIPGELYRRVKAKSVLEGRPVRAIPVELLPHLRGGTVGARRHPVGRLRCTIGCGSTAASLVQR